MAIGEEGNNSPTWLRQLGAAAAAMKGKVQKPIMDIQGCVHPEKVGNMILGSRDVPEDPHQEQGFEFADILEQGLGPGHSLRYLQPPGDPSVEERLVVKRSQNGGTFKLMTEGGQTLLLATSSENGTRFDLFVTGDGDPPRMLGPAFVLQSNATRDAWSVCSVRCEQCHSRGKRKCGTRQLARMTHYYEAVGEGQAFCMDVEIPEICEDGSPAVLCSACGVQGSNECTTELSTRRPRWDKKHKSLTLDFRGRCSMASAKNFQLEAPEKPGKVKLLFGKVAAEQFVLDYRHPLSAVQAFAASLTASHWK